MKKIIWSGLMIVSTIAAVGGATTAFFSDTETSENNTFAAGAIDLQIDSTAHYNGMICVEDDQNPGDFIWQEESLGSAEDSDLVGTTCTGSWVATDLDSTYQFFSFDDLKPDDEGENTISLDLAESNDAWMCMMFTGLENNDVSLTEPEGDELDDLVTGELGQYLQVFAWREADGDNIFDPDGVDNTLSNLDDETPVMGVGTANSLMTGASTYTVADATTGTPVPGGTTSYVGVQWCLGTLSVNLTTGAIDCDGVSVGNDAQTDELLVDISFEAVQSRNNESFECNPEE